jgi:hypothetical protein
MAYIIWKNHPYRPELNGTKADVARSLAEVAIGYGQAELCRRPAYGTAEWVQERQAAAAKAVPDSGDVDPNSKGTEWGLKDRADSPFSQVTIIKRTGSTTTYYSTPPVDCPPSIVARWAELTQVENPELVSERLHQLKNRQITQQSEEKKGVLATIFGGGK